MTSKPGFHLWDVCVVGAGAAGLMTAITAARKDCRVLLLDGKEKIGAKILMSGGTRCNLTNEIVTDQDFESEQKNILKAPLKAFSSKRAVDFFTDIGIKVIREPGGKYFPSTHSGKTVLEALLKTVDKHDVTLEKSRKVNTVTFNRGAKKFEVKGEGFQFEARTLVLTTGGLSFPATGSDGSGYEIAKGFGHSLVKTSPSLTPLLCNDPIWQEISGVSLPVKLTFQGKKKKSMKGSFLFTHFGFSGPVVLNLSRYWIREEGDKRVVANFLPEHEESDFRNDLKTATQNHPSKKLRSLLALELPSRFVDTFLGKIGMDGDVVLNQLRREDREKIATLLFSYPLPVTGDQGYGKAEVTAGGVDLREVDKNTMESRVQPGLFLAGEILDVDGRIGGFNFQWAWSTGFAAGQGVSNYLSHST